jgi:prepilin peptidase CpaA
MSPLVVVQAGSLVAFVLLLLAAGWQDLRTMRIANVLSLGVVGAFLVWALAGLAAGRLTVGAVGLAVACGALLFIVGALAFAAGALGGGDVKLLAAAGLFAGPAYVVDFLIITAVIGGLLGLAILAGAPVSPAISTGGAGSLRARLRGGLPYGPAIAAGGVWVAACLGCS